MSLGKWAILVADDDEDTRHVFIYRLQKKWGTLFEIDEASHGLEALHLLQEKRYHVVFMDLKMPVLDGWEVIEYIKGGRCFNQETRIGTPPDVVTIGLSSQGMIDDGEKFKAHFGVGFIPKPVMDTQLIVDAIEGELLLELQKLHFLLDDKKHFEELLDMLNTGEGIRETETGDQTRTDTG